MKNTVINFHRNLIDYAGLFPPAKQSMNDAWRDFCIYREFEYNWMISNFICPASRLDELQPFFSRMNTNGNTFPFSILGSRSHDSKSFRENLNLDIESINKFNKSNRKGSVEINIFETNFPISVVSNGNQNEVLELFQGADMAISSILKNSGMIFYELPIIDVDMKYIKDFIESLSKHNKSILSTSANSPIDRCGFKLRCGGVTSDAFPTVENVANIVNLCADSGVPLKATAGLHHPIRHFNNTVNTMMHGFLNIIGAIILTQSNDLTTNQICKIITDEDASSFSFSESHFHWQDLEADTKQISSARERSFISYGCCCIEEPIGDLTALGIF